jgi:hypothetical protein
MFNMSIYMNEMNSKLTSFSMQEHIQWQIWVWNYLSENCVNVDGIEKNVKLLHSTLGKKF